MKESKQFFFLVFSDSSNEPDVGKKANAREWKQVIFPIPLHTLQELEGYNREIYELPLELIKNRWQTNIQVKSLLDQAYSSRFFEIC